MLFRSSPLEGSLRWAEPWAMTSGAKYDGYLGEGDHTHTHKYTHRYIHTHRYTHRYTQTLTQWPLGTVSSPSLTIVTDYYDVEQAPSLVSTAVFETSSLSLVCVPGVM